MRPVIQTINLSKYYGSVRAVDRVSLHIEKGEIYGFLGLNGAGKTTTIRMLLGMISPTAGTAYLNGKAVNARDRDLWRSVGYLVEVPYAYPDLTVFENLEIARRLHLVTDSGAVDAIIKKMNLGEYRNRKARHLSLGNAQRLGLAKALLHSPDILLLDEPANGLDPAGIVEIRELLLELSNNREVTILISSHILGEISKLADRIGIIHQGHLIQEVTAGQLDALRQRRLLVNARDRDAAKKALAKNGYTTVESGNLVIQDNEALQHPEKIAELLVTAGCPPTLLIAEEEDIESYFLRIIDKGGK